MNLISREHSGETTMNDCLLSSESMILLMYFGVTLVLEMRVGRLWIIFCVGCRMRLNYEGTSQTSVFFSNFISTLTFPNIQIFLKE
jgi:hypothetical protein